MGRFKSTRPYWLTVKYGGECSRCKRKIIKGERAFYYPHGTGGTSTLLCSNDGCGFQASRDLAADDFDQAQMSGSY